MYDLVIFGATGYTGTLAVEYVANNYAKSISWAIAGRSVTKLQRTKEIAGQNYPNIIVADSSDKRSLQKMCNQTRVVATTAGPFSRYGSLLVEVCVDTGSDYCDIIGETSWVREMIANHDSDARATGARIVHLCGHDSVPWDLSTYKLAQHLAPEKISSVDFYDEIKSAPSGGTLETALGIMFGAEKNKKKSDRQLALGFDPLMTTLDGKESNSGVSVKNVSTLLTKGIMPRTLFFMSGVNAYTVKRSNALNNYSGEGKKMRYCEGQAHGNVIAAIWSLLQLAIFGICLYIPPLRYLMRKTILPKPGQGPTKQQLEEGYLIVTGVAIGTQGTEIKSTMTFNVDPGYKDTARMLVESALALSLDDVDCKGGVFTPGSCQKDKLFDRLMKTGTDFFIQN